MVTETNRITEAFESASPDFVIDQNANEELITALQEHLIVLGYDLGPTGADGDYGDLTTAAVMQYQQTNNLEVTGIVDATTASKIVEDAGALIQERAMISDLVRDRILDRAADFLGTNEFGGNNMGHQIELFLRTSQYDPNTPGIAAPAGSSWCAGFVSYVLEGTIPDTLDYNVVAKNFIAQFEDHGAYHSARSNYQPQPGDIIIFERGATGDWRGHVGFIESVDENGVITTIEGNKHVEDAPDGVSRHTYTPEELQAERIIGYGDISETYMAVHGTEPPPSLDAGPHHKIAEIDISFSGPR